MSPEHVASLMNEIDASDPLDFSRLAIDADGARRLMANHFCEVERQLVDCGLEPDDRLAVMAAIAAHAMVENMLLYVELLQSAGRKAEFHAWMRRHGIGGGSAD